jgi:diguanylate cyclase (GGDEF)-like protein
MTPVRRDSYSILRDTMRWRVALVLGSLVMALMFALGVLNTRLGYMDTAFLAWVILLVMGACVTGLVSLPRRLGGTLFFAAVAAMLVVVMGYGLYHGRSMQHWAYILPPVMIFLLRAGPALAGMVVYGVYATLCIVPLMSSIEVVRFASGYGLLVCFMYTYALLQERAAAMLRYHSDHDALTNCLNRRTFNESIEHLETTGPADRRCTFLLIDIDHFKSINDQHGHLVGDRIITQVAASLGRVLDAGTPLFRYGGEEFAVMCDGAGELAGLELAERLRAAIEHGDFQGVSVTVSIGVAEWRNAHGSIPAALGQADRALYMAKRGGRNRVVAASQRSQAA